MPPTSKDSKKRKRLLVRVSGEANQGGRKDMEDFTSVVFEQDPEQSFFAVFDGHGGRDAAIFAKHRLWATVKRQKGFHSSDEMQVVKAIKEGFMQTHRAMWKQLDKWPRTRHGLPSTSGTTASIVIIKGRKLYVAHVGDSGVVLGRTNKTTKKLESLPLTHDHKPDLPSEKTRIEALGGKVLSRNGVPRVAWERPVCHDHRGPIRRSTKKESVPFLAVSRALGDLWSFDYYRGEFIVSPTPDIWVHKIDRQADKFIVIASDGLWGVIKPDESVHLVQAFDKNKDYMGGEVSKRLVFRALSRWRERGLRADNTSAIVVFFEEVELAPKPEPETGSDTEGEAEDTTDCCCQSDSDSRLSPETSAAETSPIKPPALVRTLAFRCTDASQNRGLLTSPEGPHIRTTLPSL